VNKRINPAVLPPLKEPLTLAFWYKKDLRPFLSSALNDAGLGAQLDWTDYKRNIVHQLVDGLAANQHRRLDQLVNLILATADIVDPHWLKRVEDGQQKYEDAMRALASLRPMVEPLRSAQSRKRVSVADERKTHGRLCSARSGRNLPSCSLSSMRSPLRIVRKGAMRWRSC